MHVAQLSGGQLYKRPSSRQHRFTKDKMAFSLVATMTAVLALVNAQTPPALDHYQQIGNDMGRFLQRVGKLQHDNTASSSEFYSAALATEQAIAAFNNEIHNLDFSQLTPEQAKQQQANLDYYMNNLAIANKQLFIDASNAAAREREAQANYQVAQPDRQAQPQAYQRQQVQPEKEFLIATGAPSFRNKAVVKDESSSVTEAPSSTETSSSTLSSEDSKQSKSESKASKAESKSQSKEENSESKSASKASKSESSAAANNTSQTATRTQVAATSKNSTTSATKTGHKHKNSGATNRLSAGALVAAGVVSFLWWF